MQTYQMTQDIPTIHKHMRFLLEHIYNTYYPITVTGGHYA